MGDAEPVESRSQRGDVVHQGHPQREVARVRQEPRMTTLFAPHCARSAGARPCRRRCRRCALEAARTWRTIPARARLNRSIGAKIWLRSTKSSEGLRSSRTRVDMNLTVAQLFNDAAKKLRAEFEFIRKTNPHPGEKGDEAENVVRDFLNHHLPQRFRATSGIIIDTANSLSPQTDVIVYDALVSPVYRYSEEMLMLPLDMVAAVIEVKSRLNKQEIEDGYKKIAACKRLKKTPITGGDQQATGSELKSVATYGVIFGFSSDTSLATLAQHVENLNSQYEPSAWPDLIVLLDAGTIGYAARFPGASSMGHMIALGRIAAFVESVCVHLLSEGISRRTKSLIVVEAPTEKRKPEYMRRFEVVLAADGATAWKLEGASAADLVKSMTAENEPMA
jgi:hypothetical protein